MNIVLLEDRITPAMSDKILGQPVNLATLATTPDLLARTTSANPLQDLQNLVDHYNLSGLIDVRASGVALNYGSAKLLQIHLTPTAQARDVAVTLFSTGLYSFVSPNYIYPGVNGRGLVEQVPNDPQYPNQYQHNIIGSPTAWDVSTGSSSVIVALLDDGVDILHPDLISTTWTNAGEIAGDNIDNDGNGFIDDLHGWDFLSNTARVTPDDPNIDVHGTQVAGLLAGSFNNATGVAGIAGAARFLPLKVIGNGPTTSLTIARAVNYALDRGAKIINNSFNIDGFVDDPVFQAAVTSAYDSGALWFNSAGNLNLKDPTRTKLNEIIVVSATDRNDVKAAYTNYGFGIDLSAPGGTVNDPFITTLPGGGYGPAFGSSMATPLVAGTAALIWSAHAGYSRDQVASAILANADNIEALNPAYIEMLGTGRLNASKAVSGDDFVTKLGRVLDLPAPGQDAPPGFDHFSLRLLGNLEPGTVNISNFELRWAGVDNLFNTGDDGLVALALDNGDDYKLGTNSLEFSLDSLYGPGLYRFTAYSGGLKDPFNTPVDGDGDGIAGGNLVRFFGRPLYAHGTVTWDIDEDGDEPPGTSPPQPGVPGGGAFFDFNNNGNWDLDTFNSPPGPIGIPDSDTGDAEFLININGIIYPISYLKVSVLLSHAVPSDLKITLIAPDNDSIILAWNRILRAPVPADSRLFEFDDSYTNNIEESPGLLTYRLRPDDALTNFLGKNGNGVWRVVVSDGTPGDAGLLISASITIGQEPLALADANGRFELPQPPFPGDITVRPFIPEGWRLTPGTLPSQVVDLTRDPNPILNFNLIRTAGINGTVIDDVNSLGVAGAIITIDGTGITATTDALGHFAFPGLAPGTYTIKLTKLPGYSASVAKVITITTADPLSGGNDFHISRDVTPVRVVITPVTPDLRTTNVDAVSFELSEPLAELKLSDLRLTRDGTPIDLTNATLVGTGTSYTLIGLGDLTAVDGAFSLSIFAPAPVGEPDREPTPVVVSWTLDTTPPTATITPVVGPKGVVDQLTIIFNTPVNGLDVTDFVLKRGSSVISLSGASLTLLGPNAFTLSHLAPVATQAGDYTLSLNGVTDAAGNAMVEATVATWTVPNRPVRYTAIGAGEGSFPTVVVFDADGKQVRSLSPFAGTYTGGVRVATGDLNGDSTDDIIVSLGRNAGPRVKIYDGKTFTVIADYFVFEENFRGGVFVAAGDVTGDGIAELVVTPDKGGGPRVRVLNALTGATVADFFGIQDVNFRGGARTSLGDVTGDGRMDVVVAAGTGGGPRIAVFDGISVAANAPTKPFGDFLAFESSLRNGAYVTVADLNNDGMAEIIAGAGDGGGPRLSVFSGAGLMFNQVNKLADFFIGNLDSRGGLRLTVDDLDDDGVNELLVGPGSGTGSRIRVYAASKLVSQLNPDTMREFDPFGGFLGGVYLG